MTDITVAAPVTLRTATRDMGAAEIFKIYQEDGGVIIEGLVDPETLAAFNAEIDPYVGARQAGMNAATSMSAEEYAAFYGSNTKRLTQLTRRSKTFRESIIVDELIWELVRMVFPEYEVRSPWLNTAQIIDIGPGSKAQSLHRDTSNYEDYIAMGKAGREVMFNFLYALTDFTEELGATRVIPGSHEWDDFSQVGTPEDTIPVEMKAGSVLFFSGKLVHGGGANVTTDGWRRAMALPFSAGHLVPEEASPFSVDLETVRTLPVHVQSALGFRSKGAGLWTIDYDNLEDFLGL